MTLTRCTLGAFALAAMVTAVAPGIRASRDQSPGVRVSGVMSPYVPGVSLTLLWRSEPPSLEPEPPPPPGWLRPARDPRVLRRAANLRPDGEFGFENVPPGQFMLRAVTVQNVTWDGGIFQNIKLPQPALRPTMWAHVPITVGTEPVENVSVEPRPGIEISGRLEWAPSASRPSAGDIEQANIIFFRDDDPFPPNWQIQVRVSADGRFTASGFDPGRWRVHASGVGRQLFQSMKIAGRDVSDHAFEIDVSTAPTIVLSHTDRLGHVTGIVSERGLRPVTVVMFPADRTHWANPFYPLQRVRFQQTSTGTDGAYGLSTLAGDYYVVAVAMPLDDLERIAGPQLWQRLVPVATRIQVGDGLPARLDLNPVQLP